MLQSKVIKPKIKNQANKILLQYFHKQGVEQKLLNLAVAHAQGYYLAVTQFGQQPLIDKEVEEQVIKVACDYIFEEKGLKYEQN